MNQTRIYRRILVKELLRRAYQDIGLLPTDEGRSNVHGELGSTNSWSVTDGYQERLINWLVNNPQVIDHVIGAVLSHWSEGDRILERVWISDVQSSNGMVYRLNEIIESGELNAPDISERLAEGGALPMYGMPTQVKNLYHNVIQAKDGEPGESVFLAIDRPLDMSLYEFAPGSQKTKDKAIHTTIGFTSDLYNERQKGWLLPANRSFTGTAKNWTFALTRWMFHCTNCGNTYTNEQPISVSECDLCEHEGTVMEIRTPRAYRTNFSVGRDEKANLDVLLNRPPILAEVTRNSNGLIKEVPENVVENALISLSDHDRTWRINTNGGRFFKGRYVRTDYDFKHVKGVFRHQWISDWVQLPSVNSTTPNGIVGNEQPDDNPNGFALTAGKHTEIFRVALRYVPDELNLDFRSGQAGIRAAYYSAAFLIQRLLSDHLDIDPTEIEIADVVAKKINDPYLSNRELWVADVILADELPNGSGFVRYLYDHFEELMQDFLDSPRSGSFAENLVSSAHGDSCSDACYDCLKVYRNMNYHSLLDWRLGMSLLRLLRNGNYLIGIDGVYDTPELTNWFTDAHKLAKNFVDSFPQSLTLITGRDSLIPVIQKKIGPDSFDLLAVVHPLWKVDSIIADSWLNRQVADLVQQAASLGGTLYFIDTFNLRRRVGWCYEQLNRNY